MLKVVQGMPEDLPAVIQLLEDSGLPFTDLTLDHMKGFLLLTEGENLAGCAGLEIYGSSALLRSMAINDRLRGRRLGSQLLGEIEKKAGTLAVENIYLLTDTAEKFFIKHGYQLFERSAVPAALQTSPEFLSLCPESAKCMIKKVSFT